MKIKAAIILIFIQAFLNYQSPTFIPIFGMFSSERRFLDIRVEPSGDPVEDRIYPSFCSEIYASIQMTSLELIATELMVRSLGCIEDPKMPLSVNSFCFLSLPRPSLAKPKDKQEWMVYVPRIREKGPMIFSPFRDQWSFNPVSRFFAIFLPWLRSATKSQSLSFIREGMVTLNHVSRHFLLYFLSYLCVLVITNFG